LVSVSSISRKWFKKILIQ